LCEWHPLAAARHSGRKTLPAIVRPTAAMRCRAAFPLPTLRMPLMSVKLPFFETHLCQSGRFCRSCRARVEGRKYRKVWATSHPVEGGIDFICVPRSLKFDDEPGGDVQTYPEPIPEPVKEPPRVIPTHQRPKPTLSMIAAWAVAAAAGEWATSAEVAEREAICGACDKIKRDEKTGEIFCGKCGCGVMGPEKSIRNLSAYKENIPGHPDYRPSLPSWGCKHPQRGLSKPDGSGKYGWALPILSKPV
jgi:hypothetical protein